MKPGRPPFPRGSMPTGAGSHRYHPDVLPLSSTDIQVLLAAVRQAEGGERITFRSIATEVGCSLSVVWQASERLHGVELLRPAERGSRGTTAPAVRRVA